MKRYKVKFKNPSGEFEFREIDAPSSEEAENMARFQGLWPESVVEVTQGSGWLDFEVPFIGGVSLAEMFHFTRLFATLTRAGIPILETLDLLADRATHPTMRRNLEQIVDAIREGSGLHQTFSRYEAMFDATYLNLVKVGEDAGQLPDVLERLTELIERRLRLRRMIRKALAYPGFVMGVSGFVTWGILTYIVPRFKDVYGRFGVELPDLTKFTLACSDLVVHNSLKMLFGLILAIIVSVLIRRTKPGRRVFDWIALHLPLMGPMNHNYEIAQSSKSLSILIHSGVTVLGALEIVIPSIERVQIREAFERAAEAIKGGKSLGESFTAEEPWLPDLLNRMVVVGERTGNLSEMLDHVSKFYEEEFNNNVETMATLIEPILIVMLGGVIGVIVISLYLPIFSLAQLITQK